MQAIKVLPKGQITLPKKVRKKFGIRPGDSLIIEEDREKIVLKKGKTIYDYIGFLPKSKIPIEEMIEKSVEEAVKERV
ncbi:MAG: AbrB/MazE/SpoVT family DNA-binding domain-containing protein [Nitrospirae bacterium]|nr:AbrB/MazE/SpoVT family DNA-binding domain-containing protein [Nitrospirota bacterium]